jgi:hypothetical protein
VFFCWPVTVFADITVVDDSETMLVSAESVGKIVSLSQHLTELIFSLRLGDRIKATAVFFDYREAALKTLRLGKMFSVSLETLYGVISGSCGGVDDRW